MRKAEFMTLETPAYCSREDVRIRLTEIGVINTVDADDDATIEESELSDRIDTSINYGGQLVDAAVVELLSTTYARSQGNAFLRDRCVDIAVYRVVTRGGRDAPESVERDYDDALTYLQQIKNRQLTVPGLLFDPPANSSGYRRTGVPKAVNLK
jgi:phage gp36-like protein